MVLCNRQHHIRLNYLRHMACENLGKGGIVALAVAKCTYGRVVIALLHVVYTESVGKCGHTGCISEFGCGFLVIVVEECYNLREAFKLDKSLVNQAKTDLEFSRFNINSLF